MSLLLTLLPLLATSAQEETSAPRTFTLEETMGRRGPRLSTSLGSWRWVPGEPNLLLSSKGETLDVSTGVRTPPPKKEEGGDEELAKQKAGASAEREARIAALAKLEGVDEKLAKRIVRKREASSDDPAAAFYRDDNSFWFLRDGGEASALGTFDGELEIETLAPDGSFLSFVQDHDLVIVSTEDGSVRHVTENGGPDRFNGKLDWVYQEEIYGRGNFRAHWWNPASSQVAFLSLDETAVGDFTVVDHIERGHFRVKSEVTRYPKAGDPNPTVELGVVDASTGAVRWADLSAYSDSEPLVVRVGWFPTRDGEPDETRLWFCVQDRIQTWADFVVWDLSSGEQSVWIREESESWTKRPSTPRWLADGGFLWESHRTGYGHLYRYDAEGELVNAVTSGEWELRRILGLDEEAGLLWFDGTKDSAIDTNLYRVGLDGEGLVKLTSGRGTHSVRFNSTRSHFIDTVSSLSTPAETRLCDASNGEILDVLAKSERDERYVQSTWQRVEIPTRDGIALDGALLRPVPFDPSQVYPVWLYTYSGPNAPTVRNRFSQSIWNQFLAQNGIICLQVNVRSASGRGHVWTASAYKQLGVQELADLEDAVDWLTAEPWADASRVGISGHSYGGFMAAYALTHSKHFALGIAGSGVFDWGMYDTIYTERYMSTPEKNPEGYAATSVIKAASQLSGNLLITHGVMDDNVHVQNAMQLIYALQKADRSFDLMLYPQNRHGIVDRAQSWHLRQLTWRTIQEHLLRPGGE